MHLYIFLGGQITVISKPYLNMLFNSFQFLLFFPIVTIIYFLIPHNWRWAHLLIASCIFYCAFIPIYLLILIFTILIDYFAGLMIERSSGNKRKWYLILSIISNVGVLAVFKYFNFFINNIDTLLNTFHIHASLSLLNIILPIGLSFHTFQAMSYTIEVYRSHQKAERHLGIYALYVMFYPQLVAGPIERPQNILHQFHEIHPFRNDRLAHGLKMMLWGFFMKTVVADRAAIYVDVAYNHVAVQSGVTLLLATILFTFQIYADFAGYSYIAIGAAEVMGIRLMTNFNRPYFSKSISEFWGRWHISLSTWFRDYLYIPLGGNRVPIPRWYLNLFIVFVVSGFWHGANWTYIIWGALNGIYLIFAIITKTSRKKLSHLIGLSKYPKFNNILQIITTFSLTVFAWIFFRANNISDAFLIVKKIFTDHGPLLAQGGGTSTALGLATFGIILMMLIEYKREYHPEAFWFLYNKNISLRFASYICILVCILLLGVFDGGQFIYFQF